MPRILAKVGLGQSSFGRSVVFFSGIAAVAALAKLGDVGPRNKSFLARAGEHDQSDVGVIDTVLNEFGQTHPHVVVHGVELGLVVKHDGADMALLVQVDGADGWGGLLAHGQMTFC